MRSTTKASSAGSSTCRGEGLGRVVRGAFATRGCSRRADGSGAPSGLRARLAVAVLAAAALTALVGAPAQAATPTHPYLPALSHEGTLGYTCGAATDSHGDLYTAEYSSHAVKVFDPSGAFITQFTTSGEGPCGLAVDSAGNVYVAGYEAEVVKYAPAEYPPTPLTTYSSAGTPVASGAKGVAVDPANDDLYVAFSDHVSSYQPDGTPIKTTIGEGLISGASFTDVDVYGANGDVYVVDRNNSKAYVLNADGSAIRAEIDGSDSPKGPFVLTGYPNLAVDQSNGHVYVTDVNAHKVVDEFDAAGHFVSELSHTPNFVEGTPSGIAVDNSGGATQGTVYVPSGEESQPGSVYAYGGLVYGHQLKVTKTGTGNGTIAGGSAANPTAIDCGLTCETALEDGAVVTLTVTPDSHSTFTGWTGCEEEPSPTECKLTLGTDHEVKASFLSHQLTVTKHGPGTGTVTSAPAGVSCGSTCVSGFPEGAEVTLSAAADPGSRINHWSGCNQVLGAPGAQQCKLTMTANAQVSVTFSAVPAITGFTAANVTDTAAALRAEINPNGEETTYHFEYTDEEDFQENGFANATSLPVPEESIEASTEAVPVSVDITGLTPHTSYRFRLLASNVAGPPSESATRSFTTLVPPPGFGQCANDAFRQGQPSAPLPDCRAYEQASPVDKNGGDVTGTIANVKASVDGDRISFVSTAPIPGGEGAQEFTPPYLASRGAGGWSTQGLFPPQSQGHQAQLLGWSPDFSHVIARARKFGNPNLGTISDRSTATPGAVSAIVPPSAGFDRPYLAGTSDDGSIVFFESDEAALAEGATAEKQSLYVWDRETETVRLASVLNDGKAPRAGSFAGAYDWEGGKLSYGGAEAGHYLRDQHAIAADGSSVYFTASGSGQLYRRLNPAKPQSDTVINGDGEEECTQPELACTIHVSVSQKENGHGENGADPAGPHPAAFRGASRDGSKAFFTSSEMLTYDANTGPEQPPAQIGRAKIGATEAEEPNPEFLFKHAHGLATSPDGEYLYWADPKAGTIGRANLNGAGAPTDSDDSFIAPGPTEFETHPQREPGVLQSAPSTPCYVAVDDEYVYWTNTGPLADYGGGENPVEGAGTIGRAKLDSSGNLVPDSVEPEFITGASDPQGIAVNSEHIYWGNGDAHPAERREGDPPGSSGWISRSNSKGDTVELKFSSPRDQIRALALDENDLYFTLTDANGGGYLNRIPLEGGAEEGGFIGGGIGVPTSLEGISVQGPYIYWTAVRDREIGRRPIDSFEGYCGADPNCEYKYVELEGTPAGLASDGERLYWSTNGEAPPNPGNDLYRYDAASGELTDLAPDPEGNGAEVQGILGSSDDGSYVYFVANGVLAEGASPGSCQVDHRGECSLYLEHEGQVSFIARLKANDEVGHFDIEGDFQDWKGGGSPGFGHFGAKLSRVSADGRTLLFTSIQKLTGYENEGMPELYLYRVDAPEQIVCVSCSPTGVPPSGRPNLGEIAMTEPVFEALSPSRVLSRNLSADGGRVFFETPEALVASDTNGEEGCPVLGVYHVPACQDVYEWEAKGEGSCESEDQNGGCLYLVSSGKGADPSFLADASASGNDVFFFTRERLTDTDVDSLQDVYDARVGGGFAAKPVPPPPCEGEACRDSGAPSPPVGSPTTPLFSGPGNPKPHHKKAKARKHRHKHKRHAKNKGRTHR